MSIAAPTSHEEAAEVHETCCRDAWMPWTAGAPVVDESQSENDSSDEGRY
jgi:hypothetical protein